MRCSLTSRHCAFLEATGAANDTQQAVDKKWSYQSTEELTICTNCTNRKASLTNCIILPMVGLVWVFWRIRMCISKTRVWHNGPLTHSQSPSRFLGMMNRPFPSSTNSHFKNGAKCKTFAVQMGFICMRIESYFHINSFALSLALKQRIGTTRKWPIYLTKFLPPLLEGNKEGKGVTCDLDCRQILQLKVHLSRQGIRWPVSPDRIAGSSVDSSRSSVFLKLSADKLPVSNDRRLKFIFSKDSYQICCVYVTMAPHY